MRRCACRGCATARGCGVWPPWGRCTARWTRRPRRSGGRCGQVVGKRGVEQLTVAAATDIDAFYRAVVAEPCTDDTVLVLSVDGKGVVMRPEGDRQPPLCLLRPGTLIGRLCRRRLVQPMHRGIVGDMAALTACVQPGPEARRFRRPVSASMRQPIGADFRLCNRLVRVHA